jgi:hypothetical protein
MPLVPVLGLAPILAHVIQFLGYYGIIFGTVNDWCSKNPRRCNSVYNSSYVGNMNIARQEVGLCGVPAYNFDICRDQLQGVQVISSVPSEGGKINYYPSYQFMTSYSYLIKNNLALSLKVAQFDNIPPGCMNLAVVLSGSCTGEGTHPVPCGSACMQYTGLSDEQMAALSRTLRGY